MIVDGRAIAEKIRKSLKDKIREREKPLTLSVFMLTDDFATKKFVAIKQKVADELGVTMEVFNLPKSTSTEDLIERITQVLPRSGGVIIQFPLPAHIDKDRIRNAIPLSHDVDAISDVALEAFAEGRGVPPPVAGALEEILDAHTVSVHGKKMVVVGAGRLVGVPAALLGKRRGAHVTVLDIESKDMKELIKEADVLVLGAGAPGLIQPPMIKEGVVVLDAGTSEAYGELRGDADPACAQKASLFTPVPGGIGPITVALIFRNLLTLAENNSHRREA